ncbi:hypothetical protein B0H66DRAFT_627221 [Apodospora peruviana]|uniref:FAD-binding domain-containing protein n=1 Tax=Apodospora peruviana TaxID=516989 RepID=A0AAE0HXG1_9PEZI|nr:hypothetical protein B0H66DRAFT_627221 [Apodospora peruviana]
MVQCVISVVEDLSEEVPKDRKRPLTRESLKKTLEKWLDGPIAKGVINVGVINLSPGHLTNPSSYSLFSTNPTHRGYSEFEHKTTPTYSYGNVCIMGDAAHATTPWQGAGAGQAFEDAMILGTLLRNISSADDINAASRAYDAIRRPRCQRVIDSSQAMGDICCVQDPRSDLIRAV